MKHLFKISQQTLWQVLGKVVTSLSTILILGLVTRRFGEAGTGILTLSLAYLAFFALAEDFGVNAYILPRFLKGDFSLDWRKLLGFRLLLALILIIIAAVGVLLWPSQQQGFKAITLIGILMAILEPAIFTTCNAIFQSKLRYDLSIIGWSLSALTVLVSVFLVTKRGLGLEMVMLSYVAGWIVASGLSLMLVRKFIHNVVPIFDARFIGSVLKASWPISLTLVLNVVYFRLDAFLLSFLKTFSDVGTYNLAYQIFQSALVLPTFIMNSFFPLMLKDYSESRKKFTGNLFKAIVGMLILGSLGTLLTKLFSAQVIMLITGGRGFSGSAASLQILSLGFPAFFLSAVLMWTLVVTKRYKVMLAIYLTGLIFNALANLIFIPAYSYIASSWITVISEYLILVLQAGILMW